MKKTYEMNGKQYNTLTAMAKEIGISRLYTKDFAKYGIVEITDDAATQSVATDTAVAATVATNTADYVTSDTTTTDTITVDATDSDETTATDTANTDDGTVADEDTTVDSDTVDAETVNSDDAVDTTATDTTDATTDSDDAQADSDTTDNTTVDDKADNATDTATDTAVTATADPVEELEKDVVDLTFEEFGKRLKKIDNDGILRMAQNVQGNTWDEISDARIKRMRMIMEIKAAYYPDSVKKSVSTKAKKASPWKAISTDVLVKAAADKNLTYKDCDDKQIKRMRVIMALKAAGVDAESLKK